MTLRPKQIAAVIALNGPARYAHFIKVAADQRRVWGLFADGWALAANDDDQPVLPLWPAREYAALCIAGAWQHHEPRAIDLDDLLDDLLPRLRDEAVMPGVFCTPSDAAVLPRIDQFEHDLRCELTRIE